ncbi:unnamed protein product [Blepharisma stoltei]|uniref:ADP-ribosylation factor n=1 Tax=Blepharisma stoltei TaxID=1481888 RepID=A0AAU9J7Y8_9CILI|nr:unnamed protein product [Blepharisma stoltei]
MGSACSGKLKLKERRFLILGLDGAGKKTLLGKLGCGEPQHHALFEGFDWWNVQNGRCNFVSWNLGTDATKPENKPKYKDMFRNTVGIIFVIDSSNRDRFEEVKTEFWKIINDKCLRDFALLVFANKQDVQGAASEDDIKSFIYLWNVRRNKWNIQASSFKNGDGLEAGLTWLDNETGKNVRK